MSCDDFTVEFAGADRSSDRDLGQPCPGVISDGDVAIDGDARSSAGRHEHASEGQVGSRFGAAGVPATFAERIDTIHEPNAVAENLT